MRLSVVIVEVEGGFALRTTRGTPVGHRMLTASPKKGGKLPEVPEGVLKTRSEAEKAKLDWNTYLLWAWKSRSKKKERISE
jgi:hypothetical protein